MAAGLLQRHLARRGDRRGIAVSSAGFGSTGYPAADGAVAVMEDIGVDITGHRSRQADPELLEGADLILGMTRQHVIDAAVLAPAAWPKTFPLVDAVRRGSESGPLPTADDPAYWVARLHAGRRPAAVLMLPPGDDIADPIDQPIEAYRKTRDQLDGLTRRLAELLCSGDGDVVAPGSSQS